MNVKIAKGKYSGKPYIILDNAVYCFQNPKRILRWDFFDKRDLISTKEIKFKVLSNPELLKTRGIK